MRLAFCWLAISAFFGHGWSLAGDPTKDPAGWAEIRFGMLPDEVLNALGPQGYVAEPPAQALPFDIDKTVDVPSAMAYSRQQLLMAKKDPGSVSDDLRAACEALMAKSKNFLWVAHARNNPHSSFESDLAKPPQKVSGALESITSWGAKGTAAYSRTLHIKTARSTVRLPEALLEPDSKKHLASIEGAILDLANEIQRIEQLEKAKEQRHKSPTPAHLVRARPVKIRGLEMAPSFVFENGKVSRIVLTQSYEGYDLLRFDERGIQRTLAAALEEKFGNHDEYNEKPSSQEYVWRFPETVIRCEAGCQTAIGSTFSRRWVIISYEKPTIDNAAGGDNL